MSDIPLRMILWPNPVYRNQAEAEKWFFSVSLQEKKGIGVQIQRYRAEWIDGEGRIHDYLEDRLDVVLAPFEQANFPDLWVSSPLPKFIYRLILFGVDRQGKAFQVSEDLLCY